MLNYVRKIGGQDLSLELGYAGAVKSKYLRYTMEQSTSPDVLIVINPLWSRNHGVLRDTFICSIWAFYWGLGITESMGSRE